MVVGFVSRYSMRLAIVDGGQDEKAARSRVDVRERDAGETVA